MSTDNYKMFMPNALAISMFQAAIKDWQEYNFPKTNSDEQFLGMVEELGELSHSMLKQRQGIRGTAEEHEVKGKDAVADLFIFLCNYCSQRGWDLGSILLTTWKEVRQRDWQANKLTGQT